MNKAIVRYKQHPVSLNSLLLGAFGTLLVLLLLPSSPPLGRRIRRVRGDHIALYVVPGGRNVILQIVEVVHLVGFSSLDLMMAIWEEGR